MALTVGLKERVGFGAIRGTCHVGKVWGLYRGKSSLKGLG